MEISSLSRPVHITRSTFEAGGQHMRHLTIWMISLLSKWILYSSTLYLFYSLLTTLRDISSLPLSFSDRLSILVSDVAISAQADDHMFNFVKKTAAGELVPVYIFNGAASSSSGASVGSDVHSSGQSESSSDGGFVSTVLGCVCLAFASMAVITMAAWMRPVTKRSAFKRSLSAEALRRAPELRSVVVDVSLSRPSDNFSPKPTNTVIEESPNRIPETSPPPQGTTISALRLRRLAKPSLTNASILTLNPNAPVFTPRFKNFFQSPSTSPASPSFPPTPVSATASANSPRAIPTYVTSRPNRPAAHIPHIRGASSSPFDAQPVFYPVAKNVGAFVPVVVGRGAIGMVPVARRGEFF